MTLRCVSTYRNVALSLYVEAGEVLRDLTPDMEAWLLRDAPGAFEVIKSGGRGLDAPPRDRMMRREQAKRRVSEHGPDEVMNTSNMKALTRGG